MEQKTKTVKDLTVGSPFQLIIAFAIPMILGNLFQQLYNFIDTMIVGHFLGIDALAGVGATSSINFLILGFCIGVCAGFAVPIAQMFGAKKEQMLRKYVANSLYLSLGFSVVITLVVTLLCRYILIWMRTPEDVIAYSYAYIFTIFMGIPVTFFYNMLAGCLRSIGDSKTPLLFLILSTFSNIIMDLLFILVFQLGVFGAALATVLAQLISGILCLFVIKKRFSILHVSGDEWKPDKQCMQVLCRMGIPMGLQYSVTAIGSILLQSSVNVLGAMAIAAVTAAGKVSMLFMCILDALGASMATYGGQNLGAGKIDRIRAGVRAAGLLGVGYSIVAFGILYFAGKPLIHCFVDAPDPEMIRMALMHIRITALAFSLLVFVNVLRFLIQGVGYSFLAIFAGVFEMIARGVAGLFIIPSFGFVGACLASPFAWLLADLFLVPAYFYVVKKLERTLRAVEKTV